MITLFFILSYITDSFSFKFTVILVKLAVRRVQTGGDTGFNQNMFEITFSILVYINKYIVIRPYDNLFYYREFPITVRHQVDYGTAQQ